MVGCALVQFFPASKAATGTALDISSPSIRNTRPLDTGPRHRILQERDRGCCRQAMLAAQMQKSADKAVATVSVIVRAAGPVAVVGKNSSIRSSNCTAFAISASGIGLIAPDPGDELGVSQAEIHIVANPRQTNRLDQLAIRV
jgi:hypothetical protein